jgi:hypothetical protein
MQLYVLLGFSALAAAFLLMLVVQFIAMEKTLMALTERAEFFVKKIYAKE